MTQPEPRSGAVGEAVGASLGMIAGLAIGWFFVRAALPHGGVTLVAAAVGSLLLFFVLMIGGSVAGGFVRR